MTDMDTTAAPADEPTGPDKPIKRSRKGVAAAVLGATLVIGGLAGWGITHAVTAPATEAREHTIAALTEELSETETTLTSTERDLKAAKSALIPQEELEKRESAASAAEAALAARENTVKGREDAIAAKETYIKRTSLADGVYTVGVSMEGGTYRTESTNPRCYWKITTSGTNYDDIVQNDLGSMGVLTVTIGDGQDFHTARCGTWAKVG